MQKIILKNIKPYTNRPNAHLSPIDFDTELPKFRRKFPLKSEKKDFISYKLYPKVFKDYYDHFDLFDDVSNIPTKAFFYGIESGEEILIEFESGKVIIVELIYLTKANDEGKRTVFFKLNGQTRAVEIKDKTVKVTKKQHVKASETNHIGAPLQGKLVGLKVKKGDLVTADQPLFVLEAMKMESSVLSPIAGRVKRVHLAEGTMVDQNDMVVELE